jgi:hypothetical protein
MYDLEDTNLKKILSVLTSSPTAFPQIRDFSDKPGIYAFFYLGDSQVVSDIPFEDQAVLYIGKTESSQRSRDANTHFSDGKTGSSTVRRSLGAIFISKLELNPIPRNSTDYERGRNNFYKFDDASEAKITNWMVNHIAVSYFEYTGSKENLKKIEIGLIQILNPTLNIEHNHGSPFVYTLKALRKACAKLAHGVGINYIENPKKRIIPKVARSKSMSAGIYGDYWEIQLPEIMQKLESGIFPQQIQLDRREFDQRGDRSSYSFNVQYFDGELANKLGGSAVARDLAATIKNNPACKALLKTRNIKINMDSEFILWIRSI